MGNNCAFPHILGSPSSYMTLQLLHSEFPYIWGKFYFLFYQCTLFSDGWQIWLLFTLLSSPSYPLPSFVPSSAFLYLLPLPLLSFFLLSFPFPSRSLSVHRPSPSHLAPFPFTALPLPISLPFLHQSPPFSSHVPFLQNLCRSALLTLSSRLLSLPPNISPLLHRHPISSLPVSHFPTPSLPTPQSKLTLSPFHKSSSVSVVH